MKKARVLGTALGIALFLFTPLWSWAFRAPAEEPGPPSVGYVDSGNVAGAPSKPELESIDIRPAGTGLLAGQGLADGRAQVEDRFKRARSEARETQVFVDGLGYTHTRLAQFYKGIPVAGGEVILHADDRNRVYQIDGKIAPDPDLDTTPSLSEDEALQVGLDEQRGKPDLIVSEKPSLVISGNRLAYHYMLSSDGPHPGRWWYEVDARSGSVLKRYNAIRYAMPTKAGSPQTLWGRRIVGEGGLVKIEGWQDVSGNFFLFNRSLHFGVFDARERVWAQQPTRWWRANDRAAVSCAYNLALTQQWVNKTFQRNSFDDLGRLARGNVHTGRNYVNAYWDGVDFHFGDGDGIQSGPLTSLDIVAHEYGHAITQYTSGLEYYGESGALDESYADILGSAVEWANQPPDPSRSPAHADWLIGEDVWLAQPAIRDMSDPQAYAQPSYYRGRYWASGPLDNGGVHTNSGVQNFAFYLLAEGGSGSNQGHTYAITGIGIEAATRIAWRANMVYLTSKARFSDSRKAWLDAARDLGYPVQTVAAVWDAVGVKAL